MSAARSIAFLAAFILLIAVGFDPLVPEASAQLPFHQEQGHNLPTNSDSNYDCVASFSFDFCIGVGTGLTWYGPINSDGLVTSWATSNTLSLGGDVISACWTDGSNFYCAQGNSPTDSEIDFALLSTGGLGPWTVATLAAPIANGTSCVPVSGYLYCVGGFPSGVYINLVYTASFGSGSVGTFNPQTVYPQTAEKIVCGGFGADLFCASGVNGGGGLTNAYFAPVSSGVVGSWTAITSVGSAFGPGYCFGYGELICAGFNGGVYRFFAYSGGVSGTWTQTGLDMSLDSASGVGGFFQPCVSDGSTYTTCLGTDTNLGSPPFGGCGTGNFFCSTTIGRLFNVTVNSGVLTPPTFFQEQFWIWPMIFIGSISAVFLPIVVVGGASPRGLLYLFLSILTFAGFSLITQGTIDIVIPIGLVILTLLFGFRGRPTT